MHAKKMTETSAKIKLQDLTDEVAKIKDQDKIKSVSKTYENFENFEDFRISKDSNKLNDSLSKPLCPPHFFNVPFSYYFKSRVVHLILMFNRPIYSSKAPNLGCPHLEQLVISKISMIAKCQRCSYLMAFCLKLKKQYSFFDVANNIFSLN